MTRGGRTATQRTILLTGVGQPGQVGAAVAEAFAAAGDHVILVDRDAGAAGERAEAITASGGRASAYGADLADATDVARLAQAIRSGGADRLDALVHMAGGWAPGARMARLDPAHWERMLTINLTTAACTASTFLPMLRAGRGALVFFASEAALPGARVAGMAAYAVAKMGVVTIMRAIAQEEQEHGVRANALAPAAIRTASNEKDMPAGTPWVERDAVAAAVLWLCSADASAVSGELIRLAAAPPPAAPA